MYVLDTDILSLIQAGDSRVGQWRGRVDPEDVAITIITRIEVLKARFDHLLKAASGEELQRAQRWLIRSEELLSQLKVLSVGTRPRLQSSIGCVSKRPCERSAGPTC